MKIYVITQGEYSDYHICGVAVDEERAEAIRRHYDREWEPAEIEEYDTEDYENANLGILYTVRIGRNGETNIVGELPGTINERFMRNDYYFAGLGYDEFVMGVVARDPEYAKKIAQDTRAKALAEKQGL